MTTWIFRYLLLPIFYLCFPAFSLPIAAKEMTFKEECFGASFDSCYILANGEITDDTAQKFLDFSKDFSTGKIAFNSPGGSLIGGLKLGAAIRYKEMESDLGKRDPEGFLVKGECYSACTYAFLGGISRDASYGVIGFHQFYSSVNLYSVGKTSGEVSSISQQTSALITHYLVEMGVDARLMLKANDASGSQMFVPNEEELKRFNITTTFGFGRWFLEPYKDGLVAASRKLHPSGLYDRIEQLTAFCRGKKPYLLVTTSNASQLQEGFKSVRESEGKSGAELYLSDSYQPEIYIRSVEFGFREDGQVQYVDIPLNYEALNQLLSASLFKLSFDVPRSVGGFYASMRLSDIERKMLRLSFQNCF